MKLNDLKKDLLKRADVRAEYDALAEEFSIAEALMHTSQSYVAKLEGGQVSPSMKALQRYAAATGSRLKISLERTVMP
jgi:transcriptional regulator with XRE-family HTH domain